MALAAGPSSKTAHNITATLTELCVRSASLDGTHQRAARPAQAHVRRQVIDPLRCLRSHRTPRACSSPTQPGTLRLGRRYQHLVWALRLRSQQSQLPLTRCRRPPRRPTQDSRGVQVYRPFGWQLRLRLRRQIEQTRTWRWQRARCHHPASLQASEPFSTTKLFRSYTFTRCCAA